jgi:hypothetical protein
MLGNTGIRCPGKGCHGLLPRLCASKDPAVDLPRRGGGIGMTSKQRTRSSVSPPRSALMRCQLGCRSAFIVGALFVVVAPGFGRSAPQPTPTLLTTTATPPAKGAMRFCKGRLRNRSPDLLNASEGCRCASFDALRVVFSNPRVPAVAMLWHFDGHTGRA